MNPFVLDSAIQELKRLDTLQSRIAELKYFSGLSLDEIAQIMDTSPDFVRKEWTVAKAWLSRALKAKRGGELANSDVYRLSELTGTSPVPPTRSPAPERRGRSECRSSAYPATH